MKHTHARTHAKEEGSSNTARPPSETQTNGDSYEFILIKAPLSLSHQDVTSPVQYDECRKNSNGDQYSCKHLNRKKA